MTTSNSKPIHLAMTPLEWAFLILLSLLWGGSFFFVEIALRELSPFTIVFARLSLGALGLLGVMAYLGISFPRSPRVWASFFCLGLFNNALPFGLLVWGQVHLASGVAAIFNATTPLFTLVIAHFFTTDEKITPTRLLGIVIGIGGAATIIGVNFDSNSNFVLLASCACLGAAFSYGIAGVFTRRFLQSGIKPVAAATGQCFSSSMILLPLALVFDQPWNLSLPNPATIASLVAIGLFSTSLAYLLYFRIVQTAGATNLSLVTLLVPASAIVLGVGILGEQLLPKHIIGMTLIAIGLITIDGRLWRKIGGFRS